MKPALLAIGLSSCLSASATRSELPTQPQTQSQRSSDEQSEIETTCRDTKRFAAQILDHPAAGCWPGLDRLTILLAIQCREDVEAHSLRTRLKSRKRECRDPKSPFPLPSPEEQGIEECWSALMSATEPPLDSCDVQDFLSDVQAAERKCTDDKMVVLDPMTEKGKLRAKFIEECKKLLQIFRDIREAIRKRCQIEI